MNANDRSTVIIVIGCALLIGLAMLSGYINIKWMGDELNDSRSDDSSPDDPPVTPADSTPAQLKEAAARLDKYGGTIWLVDGSTIAVDEEDSVTCADGVLTFTHINTYTNVCVQRCMPIDAISHLDTSKPL